MLVVLISAGYSDNMDDWLVRFRVKLPFLILPLCFYWLPEYDGDGSTKPVRLLVMWGSVMIAWVSLVLILSHYATNFEAINDAIGRGQHIPTPVHPIRYSLYIVVCMMMCVEILRLSKISWLRYFAIFSAIAFFIYCHILSVRSGLLILYALIAFHVIRIVIKSGKWIVLPAFAVLVGLGFTMSYHYLPSFTKKVDYTRWDMNRLISGNITDYSDAERVVSLRAGWQLVKENPIMGTGLGDLRDEMEIKYKDLFDLDLRKRPHNQYMTFWAGAGTVGLLIFLLGFYGPLTRKRAPTAFLFGMYILASLSFLVENTIDGAVGTALILGYLLWAMKEE